MIAFLGNVRNRCEERQVVDATTKPGEHFKSIKSWQQFDGVFDRPAKRNSWLVVPSQPNNVNLWLFKPAVHLTYNHTADSNCCCAKWKKVHASVNRTLVIHELKALRRLERGDAKCPANKKKTTSDTSTVSTVLW